MSDVRFLLQVCHAYKDVGGTTIVILTETPKLEIQAWFRFVLLLSIQMLWPPPLLLG